MFSFTWKKSYLNKILVIVMITKLTSDQENKVKQYQKNWSDSFFSFDFDEDKVCKFIDKLYSYIDKKPPIKIILDSPMSCQLAINLLKNQEYIKTKEAFVSINDTDITDIVNKLKGKVQERAAHAANLYASAILQVAEKEYKSSGTIITDQQQFAADKDIIAHLKEAIKDLETYGKKQTATNLTETLEKIQKPA